MKNFTVKLSVFLNAFLKQKPLELFLLHCSSVHSQEFLCQFSEVREPDTISLEIFIRIFPFLSQTPTKNKNIL